MSFHLSRTAGGVQSEAKDWSAGVSLLFSLKQSRDVDVDHRDLLQMICAQVRACVLYMDPSTRVVGLSLRRYLLQPGAAVEPCPVDRIGEVVEKCKIAAIHHMSGALLELPGQTVTFVHVSLLAMYDHPAE